MGNLLDEPRMVKDVMVPKVKKRLPKKVKSDEPKDVKFTVIKETSKTRVDELVRLYKVDPFKARVKYFSEKNTNGGFNFSRIVLFEYPDGNFQIVNFLVKFGISTTNRIYSSQSKGSFISYKNGKFWYKGNIGNIRPLNYATLVYFANECYISDKEIFEHFDKKFHWFKNINEIDIANEISFNTIVSKKLFGLNDILRYKYKVPINVVKTLLESQYYNHLKKSKKQIWVETLKTLENVNELRLEMLNSDVFKDTCKMARILGRKVNCKWGLKRLKQEHDDWSKEITLIQLDSVIEYEMKIKKIYKLFAEFSGYRLLRTNKDMLAEGSMMKHCVGTYIDDVEKGTTAIYHVKGYTLQLNEWYHDQLIDGEKKRILTLRNLQFRGYKNENAPKELYGEVKEKIERFLESKLYLDLINPDTVENNDYDWVQDLNYQPNELPF
jgi:hypothetical protein